MFAHSASSEVPRPRPRWRPWPDGAGAPTRLLVASGVLMFGLYILMDVVASLTYAGYSYRDQTISELSAVGAPTRTFWLAMSVAYQVLAFTFAVGVLTLAAGRHLVRTVGWLLLAAAVVGLLWWFAPMHQREVLANDGGTWQDNMHLILGAISSVLLLLIIVVGASAFGSRFRDYSFVTIAALLICGALTSSQAPNVADNEPTAWLGIWERIAVEGAMLWEASFAAVLLWRSRVGAMGAHQPDPL